MPAVKRAVPATLAAQPRSFSSPSRKAGTLASEHERQGRTKTVYLINVTSREPEEGIPEEMQQGRISKSAWILLAVHSLIYMHLSKPSPAAASFIKPTGTAN